MQLDDAIINSKQYGQYRLNLMQMQLTDQSIGFLCDYLARHPEITYLDLSSNNIGCLGAELLAANQTITHLIIRYNHIGVKGAQALALNKTIIRLNLYDNQIGNEGMQALAKNKTINHLNVGKNGIDGCGIEALAQNSTVSTLTLSGNKIDGKGIKILAASQTIIKLDVCYSLSLELVQEFANYLLQNHTLLKFYNDIVPTQITDILSRNKSHLQQAITMACVLGNMAGNQTDSYINRLPIELLNEICGWVGHKHRDYFPWLQNPQTENEVVITPLSATM